MTATELHALCQSAAESIYGHTAPTRAYATAVGDLLAGTAATESHLIYRRQGRFTWANDNGAWGLWQTEAAAVEDSLAYLVRRDDVCANAMVWLFRQGSANVSPLLALEVGSLLRLISGWDRLACLFARLHYLRVPGPVPMTHAARATYYKHHYNTPLGKGTPDKYLADYYDAFTE